MKVKIIMIISFFFLWFDITLFAQNLGIGHITGSVIDSLTKGEMPLASIIIHQDGKQITGLQTNKNGRFTTKKISYGVYDIDIQYVGYHTNTIKIVLNTSEIILTPIKMSMTQLNLSEVKVVGKKPFIEQSIDRMTLNVSESITGAGGFATDLLKRVPGMSVSNEGSLTFRGRKTTQVMIDGKLINLSSEDIGKLLESMPTGSIDKIEIITNPSAKYDAEGRGAGIVNIKTIKGKSWGTNGNFNASIGMGEQYRYNTGLDLNYRGEKINLFGSYNRVDNQQYFIVNTKSIRNKTLFDESNLLNIHRFNNTLRLGIDYQLNKKITLGLLITGFSNQAPAERNAVINFINSPKNTVDSTLTSQMSRDLQWNNGTINLNFFKAIDSTGKTLKIDLDYLNNYNKTVESFTIKRSYPNINNSFFNYFRNNMPLKVEMVSANLDYLNPIREGHELSIGIKTRITWLNNDTRFEIPKNDTWQVDIGRTNLFEFKENVNAAYINYKTKIKDINLVIGLRGEHTRIEGNSITRNEIFTQNYFQLFPNITLQKKYGKDHEVKISYQKSIGRPSYDQFNPFLNYSDTYNLGQGNPTLKPAIYQNIDATYSYQDALFIGFGVNVNEGGIGKVPRQIGQVLAYVYENFVFGEDYYFNVDYIKSPLKWWQTNNSVGIYYQHVKGNYENAPYQFQTPFYAFYSINNFTLGKGYNAEFSGYYKSDGIYGIYAAKGFTYFDAGLSKNILEGKGSLKLSLSDIFNGLKSGWDVQLANVDISARRKDETRFVKLNFTYRFGNTNVKRSRNRQTGLSDESKRLGSQN
jgi:Outer membrane protein beta-barrel family/CarboxypepD_reg-like domain